MSTPVTPATPVLPIPGTPETASVKLTAIQVIEKELQGFFKQADAAAKAAEQAVANSHAVQGAIQGAQHLLAKLRAEEAKAYTFAQTEAEKVEAEVVKGIHAVEAKKL